MDGVGHFVYHAPYQLARASSQTLMVKMSPLWVECQVPETFDCCGTAHNARDERVRLARAHLELSRVN